MQSEQWSLPFPSIIFYGMPIRWRWKLAHAAARALSRPDPSAHQAGEVSRAFALVPIEFMRAQDLLTGRTPERSGS